MVKCLNGGSCVWKDEYSFCKAPLPGKMRLSCNCIVFAQMSEVEKLAQLLEHTPGLTVGECSYEDYLQEASWLHARGVRVEDV